MWWPPTKNITAKALKSSASASIRTSKSSLSYTKQMNMTWPQFFDGQGWDNKLAMKYGIMSIPASFLLDGNGKIIGQGFAR